MPKPILNTEVLKGLEIMMVGSRDLRKMAGVICRRRLRTAHSFNRVVNAPRFVFQISNFKLNNRGPSGTETNEPLPTMCGISSRVHKAGVAECSLNA